MSFTPKVSVLHPRISLEMLRSQSSASRRFHDSDVWDWWTFWQGESRPSSLSFKKIHSESLYHSITNEGGAAFCLWKVKLLVWFWYMICFDCISLPCWISVPNAKCRQTLRYPASCQVDHQACKKVSQRGGHGNQWKSYRHDRLQVQLP